MTDDRNQHLRLVEAILFAAKEPLGEAAIGARLPDDTDVAELLGELAALYDNRGINLDRPGGKWAFRTAPDLAGKLDLERETSRRLSRAGIETLAIIAYHQPITRAEIEEIRGVAVSRGTIDVLLECDWIKPGRRRESPGRPVTWVTSAAFLNHFGLERLKDLPGMAELRDAGLLEKRTSLDVYASRAEDDAEEETTGDLLDDLDPLDDEDAPPDPSTDEPTGAGADPYPR